MSTNLDLNLADLVRHYHDRTSAQEATGLLDRSNERRRPGGLALLLRDHRTESITKERELERRAALDALLTFYGILEIGIVAGAVPWPLPEELSGQIRRHLSQPDVRRYFRDFYPLDLPAMLAARLEGWRGPRGRLTRQSEALFQRFLDLSSEIEENKAVDTFLWFLDDGYRDGYSLSDCYGALRSVKRYIAHIAKPPAERNALDHAVVGIGDYLSFCRALDELLLDAAELPNLQRAMWCHHAYWFRSAGKDVEEVIARLDSLVRGWTKRPTEASGRSRPLRPDARLMRLVRGAYRFRSVPLKVPVSEGAPLVSLARREKPVFVKLPAEV